MAPTTPRAYAPPGRTRPIGRRAAPPLTNSFSTSASPDDVGAAPFDPTRGVRIVPSNPAEGRAGFRTWNDRVGCSALGGKRTTTDSHRAVLPRSIRNA